jgi:hypothetical protein
MAGKGPGDGRAGALGPLDIFQPYPGSGLVEPDMPEIRTQFSPSKTRGDHPFKQIRPKTAIKEQQGGQSAPAIVTMAWS